MRSPYPGFTALNRRRHALILQKHQGPGLTRDETRELAMLQRVCDAMVDYRYPRTLASGFARQMMARAARKASP